MTPTLPIYIDSSMLSAWRSCRRKHNWSYYHALYPMGSSVHLIAGAAFASALEGVRKFIYTHPSPDTVSFRQMEEVAYDWFKREWKDYRAPEKSAKNEVNTFSAVLAYLREYDPRKDIVQPYRRHDGTPCVEYTFSIPLDVLHPSGEPFVFVGRFDLLGIYNNAFPVVQDEKTTSAFSIGWLDQWSLRGQFMGYIWALWQQGIKCEHAHVRGVAIQKREIKFQPALIQFPTFMIHRWHQITIQTLKEITEAYSAIENGADPDTQTPFVFGDACTSYGGCAFQMLCTAPEAEPWFSNYTYYRWNPLNKQPVEELK